MAAFTVQGVIELLTSGFEQTLQNAEQQGQQSAQKIESSFSKLTGTFNKLKKAWPVIAIAAAGKAIYSLAKETAAAGDAIDKNSQKLGISRKAYQEWEYILSQNGTSIDKMKMSFKTMTTGIEEGSKKTKGAVEQLGLNLTDLGKQTPEQQFETLVTSLQGVQDQSKKLTIATALFGRGAQELMPLLNGQAGSFEELRQRANELGIVLDDSVIDASVNFTDSLDTLSRTWNAMKLNLGAQFLKPLTNMFTKLAEVVGTLSKDMKAAFESGDWSQFFKDLGGYMKEGIPALIDTVVGIINGILDNADEFVQLALTIIEGLVDGLTAAIPVLVAKLPTILATIGTSIKNIISRLLSGGFSGVMDSILTMLGMDDEKKAKLLSIFEANFSGVMGIADSIAQTFSGIWGHIQGYLSGEEDIQSAIGGIFDAVFGTGESGTSGILGIASAIASSFTGVWTAILEAIGLPEGTALQITGIFDTAFAGAFDAAQGIIDFFRGKDGQKGIIGKIVDIFGDTSASPADKIKASVDAWFGSTADGTGIYGIAKSVTETFSNLVGDILGVFGLDEEGQKKVTDFINSIFGSNEPGNKSGLFGMADSVIKLFTGEGENKGLIGSILACFDGNTSIGDAINGIVQSIFGIDNGDGTFSGGLGGIVDTFMTTVNNLVPSIMQAFGVDEETSASLMSAWNTAFGGIKDLFTGFSDTVSGIITFIQQILSGNFGEATATAYKTAFGDDGKAGVIGTIISNFSGLVSGAITVIGNLFGIKLNAADIKAEFDKATEAILGPIRDVISWCESAFGWLEKVFGFGDGSHTDTTGKWSKYFKEGTDTTALMQKYAEAVFDGDSPAIEAARKALQEAFLDTQQAQEMMPEFFRDVTNWFMDPNNWTDTGITLPDGWFSSSASGAASDLQATLSETEFSADVTLNGKWGTMPEGVNAASVAKGASAVAAKFAGHATGLDYVPFDNYVSRLHRGEAVLSAFEAAQWRDRGQLYGAGGNTYNDSSTLYVGQMYMSNDLDAEQLQQTLANITRRRNRGYGIA